MREAVKIEDRETLLELIEEGEIVSQERAKWGTDMTYKVDYKGSPYLVTVLSQPQEGIEFWGYCYLYPAVQVTKTVQVWEQEN